MDTAELEFRRLQARDHDRQGRLLIRRGRWRAAKDVLQKGLALDLR